jgi:hypothetical protein
MDHLLVPVLTSSAANNFGASASAPALPQPHPRDETDHRVITASPPRHYRVIAVLLRLGGGARSRQSERGGLICGLEMDIC